MRIESIFGLECVGSLRGLESRRRRSELQARERQTQPEAEVVAVLGGQGFVKGPRILQPTLSQLGVRLRRPGSIGVRGSRGRWL